MPDSRSTPTSTGSGQLDEELPWSFLDTGMKDSLLKDQLAKADRLVA